jgi:hypothetical protein
MQQGLPNLERVFRRIMVLITRSMLFCPPTWNASLLLGKQKELSIQENGVYSKQNSLERKHGTDRRSEEAVDRDG